MDEIPVLGHDVESQLFKQFLVQYDVPAYMRRAQQVQAAFEHLVARCRRQREAWLDMVRLRLGRLHALAGDWDRLLPWLADGEQVEALRRLHATLEPRLRVPIAATSSPRVLGTALVELQESIERFNRRWLAFLRDLDFDRVNELRDGYNRYFVLEKECAVRSARLARQGFVRLEPVTVEELTALLPPLAVPRLQAG
jgi:hypothetical protein